MGENSKIEWTQSTWNPVVGCTRASAGCDHCYAVTMTKRLAAMGQKNYMGLTGNGHFNGVVRTLPEVLSVPMQRKKPTTYFVNSMSDLFHKSIPDEFIDLVFAVMASCPQHTFQILTKRADHMAAYMGNHDRLENIYAQWYSVNDRPACAEAWPLPNVWLGVSVENQEAADKRIPTLLQVPAKVRFLSCEPLLGTVDLRHVGAEDWDVLSGWKAKANNECGWANTSLINWVICGGESGHDARPMHPQWARDLRDQCQTAEVPFFFKQWSEWAPAKANEETEQIVYNNNRLDMQTLDDGSIVYKFGKKVAGRLLDGRQWDQLPVTE